MTHERGHKEASLRREDRHREGTRSEKQTNGQENVKNQKKKKKKKRALVCYNCGGKGHSARLCPTPPDHAIQAVDEEGDTDEESSEEGDVCGVELSM